MTLDQLRIFVEVAKSLSMTRAAKVLNLSQPAVSAAIAVLEDRYAMPLFDRVGRGLELTEAGRLFLPEAKAVMVRASEARRVLRDMAELVRGEVRIAASQTVATYWLPERMARFAAKNPHIGQTLSVSNTQQATAAVLVGEADLAIVEGKVEAAALRQRVVGGDKLGLYARPDHPLAVRPLDRDDLLKAIWILRERGSGTRDHLAEVLATHHIDLTRLTVRLDMPSNGAVLEAVVAGQFVTAISELAATARVQAGLIQRLDYEFPTRRFSLLLHKERRIARATAAFLDAL